MAQVPNRYYNSPWIADAARNLTMAMFPDEREQEALSQSRYNFQQRVKADELAEQTRANQEMAAGRLADILTMPEDQRLTAGAEAIRLNPQLTGEVFSALGTQAPGFGVKEALADQKNTAALQMLQERLGNQSTMLGDRLAAMWGMALMRDETQRRGQDMSSEDRRYASDNTLQGVQDRIKARASGQANPLKVSPTDMQNFTVNAAMRAQQTGLKLDPARRDAVVARAAELYQQGRNAGAALDQAFNEVIAPGSYTEEMDSGWFGRSSPTGVMAPLSEAMFGGAPTAAPAAQATAPPAAIEYLRQHPESRAYFQQKYGYLPPGM